MRLTPPWPPHAGEAGPAALSLDGAVNDRVATGQTLTLTGVENVAGSDGDDVLSGDAGFNHLDAGPGNDKVDGAGGGHDVIRAGAVRATAAPKDNLVLARSMKAAVTKQRTFTLRPSRPLTRGLKSLSVRVTATSAAGVVTRVKRPLKLR